MASIIKQHMLKVFEKKVRLDLRKFEDYREISLDMGVVKGAEGSARVKIGNTEVLAGVKFEVGTPFPDTPDQGGIIVNVELRPLSSPEFESGPPTIEAIELSRVIDRALREGGALELKKLSIKEGELMWMVVIDIYPINHDGNLFDAASLAALAALKDAKFPKLEGNKVNYKEITSKKLELKNMPLSCTVYNIAGNFIIDPTYEEEKTADSRLTVGVLENGSISSLQKGGNQGLSNEEINSMIELAIKKSKELRKAIPK
mgnify:CR=1 FL=1